MKLDVDVALPLVEKLKELVKKLTVKADRQQEQISRLTNKVMEQSATIDRLQYKATDLEHYFGREQVQSIVERSKVAERAAMANKRPKRAYEMSR